MITDFYTEIARSFLDVSFQNSTAHPNFASELFVTQTKNLTIASYATIDEQDLKDAGMWRGEPFPLEEDRDRSLYADMKHWVAGYALEDSFTDFIGNPGSQTSAVPTGGLSVENTRSQENP